MEILNREVSKDGDNFIILENIRKTYTYNDLFNELQNIQRQKVNIINQNQRLKSEYNELVRKEIEIQEILNQDGYVDFEELT